MKILSKILTFIIQMFFVLFILFLFAALLYGCVSGFGLQLIATVVGIYLGGLLIFHLAFIIVPGLRKRLNAMKRLAAALDGKFTLGFFCTPTIEANLKDGKLTVWIQLSKYTMGTVIDIEKDDFGKKQYVRGGLDSDKSIESIENEKERETLRMLRELSPRKYINYVKMKEGKASLYLMGWLGKADELSGNIQEAIVLFDKLIDIIISEKLYK